MREFVEIACYFIFAMMWNLLAGYGGMVSIGQQAFFGFGGYAMLMLGNFAGVNPFVAIPLGALAAGLIAVPVSFVAFRLSGGYFAIGTWVIAEVFRLSFANVSAVGGGSGTSLTALRGIERATRENATYWMALACVVAAIALVYLFLRSKRGLALLAIRDNEVAAESQGIPVSRMKLAVYVVAAFGAGLAGRALLRRQPAHQPGCGLQRQLDRLRDLHGGDRRHRPHRGAARGRAHLLGAEQVLERLRHLVPARARACWPSSSPSSSSRACGASCSSAGAWSLFRRSGWSHALPPPRARITLPTSNWTPCETSMNTPSPARCSTAWPTAAMRD